MYAKKKKKGLNSVLICSETNDEPNGAGDEAAQGASAAATATAIGADEADPIGT